MIDATFSITTNIVSNTQFNGTITFAMDVTQFTDADITLTAVDGNGITGVSFTVTGSGTSYIITFTLPSDAEGAFSVAATGMVLPDGESQEQAIVANPTTVHYDTSVAVTAAWGSAVDYTVGEAQIAIPITFASDVVVTDAEIFNVTPVSPLTDDDLEGLQADINGDSTAWTLTLTVPLDVDGDISIDAHGEVFKVSTMVYDTVTIAALTLAVNTVVPEIVKSEQAPEPYTPADRCDFVFQFNTPIEFYDTTVFFPNDPLAMVLDYFLWTGLNDIGMPTLYVYSGAGFPSLPLPDTLPAEWTAWGNGAAASAVYLFRYDPIDAMADGAPIIEVKAGTYFNPGT